MIELLITGILFIVIVTPVINAYSKAKKELREYENNETNRQ